jgi:hypothetical protein
MYHRLKTLEEMMDVEKRASERDADTLVQRRRGFYWGEQIVPTQLAIRVFLNDTFQGMRLAHRQRRNMKADDENATASLEAFRIAAKKRRQQQSAAADGMNARERKRLQRRKRAQEKNRFRVTGHDDSDGVDVTKLPGEDEIRSINFDYATRRRNSLIDVSFLASQQSLSPQPGSTTPAQRRLSVDRRRMSIDQQRRLSVDERQQQPPPRRFSMSSGGSGTPASRRSSLLLSPMQSPMMSACASPCSSQSGRRRRSSSGAGMPPIMSLGTAAATASSISRARSPSYSGGTFSSSIAQVTAPVAAPLQHTGMEHARSRRNSMSFSMHSNSSDAAAAAAAASAAYSLKQRRASSAAASASAAAAAAAAAARHQKNKRRKKKQVSALSYGRDERFMNEARPDDSDSSDEAKQHQQHSGMQQEHKNRHGMTARERKQYERLRRADEWLRSQDVRRHDPESSMQRRARARAVAKRKAKRRAHKQRIARMASHRRIVKQQQQQEQQQRQDLQQQGKVHVIDLVSMANNHNSSNKSNNKDNSGKLSIHQQLVQQERKAREMLRKYPLTVLFNQILDGVKVANRRRAVLVKHKQDVDKYVRVEGSGTSIDPYRKVLLTPPTTVKRLHGQHEARSEAALAISADSGHRALDVLRRVEERLRSDTTQLVAQGVLSAQHATLREKNAFGGASLSELQAKATTRHM